MCFDIANVLQTWERRKHIPLSLVSEAMNQISVFMYMPSKHIIVVHDITKLLVVLVLQLQANSFYY